jgi:hypothetical protein
MYSNAYLSSLGACLSDVNCGAFDILVIDNLRASKKVRIASLSYYVISFFYHSYFMSVCLIFCSYCVLLREESGSYRQITCMRQRNRVCWFSQNNMNTAKSTEHNRALRTSIGKGKHANCPLRNQSLRELFKSASVPLGIGGSSCFVHSMVFSSV